MYLPVDIQIPYLWGEAVFTKSEWGPINYLVGPNGTGKSQFAERLKYKCEAKGLRPRYLNAERLMGLEKQQAGHFGYSQLSRGFDLGNLPQFKEEATNLGLAADAFIILKERIDVRIRIEAVLSQLFNRRIRLAEEGGFLKPKVQRIIGGEEYGLKEGESHGLKELITLLTFIYDDQFDCLILDEPELHLHPQFQNLLLQEIRMMSGDPISSPGKKCFFIITHSPYMVDIRSIEDLKNCVVFQHNQVPSYIDQLTEEDTYRLERFLPRLNTHHKQFFFASQPIFVEGYFDQQIFTLIEEKRNRYIGATGVSFIDVDGKDTMDLFYRICSKLKINAKFIVDLDAVFMGKLRQTVSSDPRTEQFVQRAGIGRDVMEVIGSLEQVVHRCIDQIQENDLQSLLQGSQSAQNFVSAFLSYTKKPEKLKRRTCILVQALNLIHQELCDRFPDLKRDFEYIKGKMRNILQAFESAGVFILSYGTLENYLPSFNGHPFDVTEQSKSDAFKAERDFLLGKGITSSDVSMRYADLVQVLDSVVESTTINIDTVLSYTIGDWVHRLQSAIVRKEIWDKPSLERHSALDWQTYSRIFRIERLDIQETGFTCDLRLLPVIDRWERTLRVTDSTVPARLQLPHPELTNDISGNNS